MMMKIDSARSGPLAGFVAAGADYFGLGCILPLMPFFVSNAGADESWVGLIITVRRSRPIRDWTAVNRLHEQQHSHIVH